MAHLYVSSRVEVAQRVANHHDAVDRAGVEFVLNPVIVGGPRLTDKCVTAAPCDSTYGYARTVAVLELRSGARGVGVRLGGRRATRFVVNRGPILVDNNPGNPIHRFVRVPADVWILGFPEFRMTRPSSPLS